MDPAAAVVGSIQRVAVPVAKEGGVGAPGYLDGIVDDPLDSDENLHLQRRWRRRRCVREGLARRGGGVRWCHSGTRRRSAADGRTLDGGAVMCH